jgi:hypothetical protein
VHFWINSGVLYNQLLSTGPMAVLNLGDLYKDNASTATLSFENGKILLNSKSYIGDKMLDFYKNYLGGKISEEMLQRLPGKDVAGALAFNFNPQAIKGLLKMLNQDGNANAGLGQLNLTLDDITNAFKGDIVMGATDMTMSVDSAANKGIVHGKYVFAASIGDKDAFNKLFGAFKNVMAQQGKNIDELPVSMDNNGTYFVVSNTKENSTQYLSGPNSNKFDFINNINGQPLGAYINIQSLLKCLAGSIDKDSVSQALYKTSLDMWGNVYMKGGALDGNTSTGLVEFDLVDSSTNSLKQLNQYLGKLSILAQQKKKMYEAEMEKESKMYADTSKFTPPPAADIQSN